MMVAGTSMMPACVRTTGRAGPATLVSPARGFGTLRQRATATGTRRVEGPARPTDAHDHQEARDEAAEVQHGGRALAEVVRVRAPAAYPVGQGREHVRRHDQQRVVGLPQRARQDDQEEAHGQHKRQGDDGFEAGGRHGGRCGAVADGLALSFSLFFFFFLSFSLGGFFLGRRGCPSVLAHSSVMTVWCAGRFC